MCIIIHVFKIQRKCPRCDNDEMAFTTRQLRSADGNTFFYQSSHIFSVFRGTNCFLSMSKMLVCIF